MSLEALDFPYTHSEMSVCTRTPGKLQNQTEVSINREEKQELLVLAFPFQ